MTRLPHSLQGRLLVLVLGLVAGVWLATAAMTWIDVRHELDELLDSHLAQAAALLVAQQARESGDDDHGVDAPSLHRYAPRVAFQVFHEGRLGVRSNNAPATPMIGSGEPFRTGFRTVRMAGAEWRVFGAHGGERDVQVYVGEQMGSRISIAWAVLRSMLWPMLVALPLLAAAAWWAVNRGIAPLRRLGRTLAERQPQTLLPVAVAGAPAEMVPLVDALNGLLQRIGALMESERRFTADAAHELRTPLAAIRAQAQVALGAAEDAQRRHALAATMEGCDRVVRLVEQLLTLSRLETGAAPDLAAVDLSVLVRSVVAQLVPEAIQSRQTIAVDAPDSCAMQGNPALLAVLVRNLVDNGIRYSPSGAAVNVAVTRHADGITLTVEDSGPGMSDTDMNRLGERFFRVLGSERAGSGLGWSIVHRIAAAHGAVVRVGRSAKLKGLAVQVGWLAQPHAATRTASG